MRKKHNLSIFVVILALIAALFYMQKSATLPQGVPPEASPQSDSVSAIKAQIANLELAYPVKYATYEKVRSPYTKTLDTVVWYENTEANKSFFTGGKGSQQEPPVTISLDVYDNQKNLSPRQLLSADIPYMFVGGDGARVTVGGLPAQLLDWNGFYRGKSVMINHKGITYVLSVTFIAPTDAILKDFDLVLSSLSFK